MNRRKALMTGSVAVSIGLAGCFAENVDVPEEDLVHDLPRPVMGDPDSEVVVKVFEDYGCPGCGQYNRQLVPSIKEDYIDTNKIAYEYYDWPIPVQTSSEPAANVGRYVQDTVGNDAFWNFKQDIYQNQDDLGTDMLVSKAVEHGADEDGADYARHGVYEPVITADREYGAEIGVTGTPTILVNGERPQTESGGLSYAVIADRIDANL